MNCTYVYLGVYVCTYKYTRMYMYTHVSLYIQAAS